MIPIPFMSFTAVVCDPPWEFTTYSDAGQHKSASEHYDTMPTADIIGLREALNLDWIFAPDCVLLMWTTWNKLAEGDAHAVLKGWGFTPKAGGAWFKKTKNDHDAIGTGYMFRDSCEPFLVGTRGKIGLPKARNIRNGFSSKRAEHSRKPDYLHRALEAMYPGGPYLELFARETRPGWNAWGNETAKFNGGPAAREPKAPVVPVIPPLLLALEAAA